MEVAETNFLAGEDEVVGAVLLSLEADGHFALSLGVEDGGIVLAVHRHVDFAAAFTEAYLAQVLSFAKAHASHVDFSTVACEVHVELAAS